MEIFIPVITALITAGLGLIGTVTVVKNESKATRTLTEYRIKKLEEKQDKHNSVIERMYIAEKSISVLDEKVKVINHRIQDIEELEKEEG